MFKFEKFFGKETEEQRKKAELAAQLESEHATLKGEMDAFLEDISKRKLQTQEEQRRDAYLEKKLSEIKTHEQSSESAEDDGRHVA